MARIMTVDDSRLVRSIITASLGEAGYETVEAENGKQAMELLAEAPVDLILLDVMMPVMDGPTMLATLRAADNEVPVILLTSKTETSVIARCMQHNLTDYIVKPVKTDELTMKVGKVLGDNFTPGEKAEEEETAVVDVLLVDDSQKVADKFAKFIPERMEFKSCVSSEEAIQLCNDFKFKTVIIDMIIPDEDSLELAGRIKALLPNARYLAMYLRNVADPMNEAFTAGFDGYITKPFQASQIEDLVLINSENPESFDEILMIDENLLQAKPGRGKGEYEEYYSRMAELIGGAIEQLASDCFDDVTLDYTNLPASSLMTMLVSVSLQCCSELGLEARIVGGDDVRAAIEAEDDAEGVQVFDTLAEAMASAG